MKVLQLVAHTRNRADPYLEEWQSIRDAETSVQAALRALHRRHRRDLYDDGLDDAQERMWSMIREDGGCFTREMRTDEARPEEWFEGMEEEGEGRAAEDVVDAKQSWEEQRVEEGAVEERLAGGHAVDERLEGEHSWDAPAVEEHAAEEHQAPVDAAALLESIGRLELHEKEELAPQEVSYSSTVATYNRRLTPDSSSMQHHYVPERGIQS